MPELHIRILEENDPDLISRAFRDQGWHKPAEQYRRYLQEQQQGDRVCLVAEKGGRFAGYVNVVWRSDYPFFQERSIPEIQDFNVLIGRQRQGIGSRLMDEAEAVIGQRSPLAGIGVGLFSDYGNAQRLYARRGYVPDGKGIFSGGRYIRYGDTVTVDDDVVLYWTKQLNRKG